MIGGAISVVLGVPSWSLAICAVSGVSLAICAVSSWVQTLTSCHPAPPRHKTPTACSCAHHLWAVRLVTCSARAMAAVVWVHRVPLALCASGISCSAAQPALRVHSCACTAPVTDRIQAKIEKVMSCACSSRVVVVVLGVLCCTIQGIGAACQACAAAAPGALQALRLLW